MCRSALSHFQPIKRLANLAVLSVQEWRPRAVRSVRLSTRYVVMPPPEHEAQIAGAMKRAHSSQFVPTIL
jgi:hypothetical protein